MEEAVLAEAIQEDVALLDDLFDKQEKLLQAQRKNERRLNSMKQSQARSETSAPSMSTLPTVPLSATNDAVATDTDLEVCFKNRQNVELRHMVNINNGHLFLQHFFPFEELCNEGHPRVPVGDQQFRVCKTRKQGRREEYQQNILQSWIQALRSHCPHWLDRPANEESATEVCSRLLPWISKLRSHRYHVSWSSRWWDWSLSQSANHNHKGCAPSFWQWQCHWFKRQTKVLLLSNLQVKKLTW